MARRHATASRSLKLVNDSTAASSESTTRLTASRTDANAGWLRPVHHSGPVTQLAGEGGHVNLQRTRDAIQHVDARRQLSDAPSRARPCGDRTRGSSTVVPSSASPVLWVAVAFAAPLLLPRLCCPSTSRPTPSCMATDLAHYIDQEFRQPRVTVTFWRDDVQEARADARLLDLLDQPRRRWHQQHVASWLRHAATLQSVGWEEQVTRSAAPVQVDGPHQTASASTSAPGIVTCRWASEATAPPTSPSGKRPSPTRKPVGSPQPRARPSSDGCSRVHRPEQATCMSAASLEHT